MKVHITRIGRGRGSAQLVRRFYGRAFATAAVVACFASIAFAQSYAVTNLGTLTGLPYTSPAAINNAGQVAGSGTAAFQTYEPFRTRPNAAINSATDDLGLLTSVGATSGQATSINASGQVAGTAGIPIAGEPGFFLSVAFRADPGNPNLVDLGTRTIANFPGNNTSNANGINASGQVTGSTATEEAIEACLGEVEAQAFLTTPDGLVNTSTAIGTTQPGNCGFSFGFALNNSGQVVGYNNLNGFSFQPYHAFLATPNTTNVDLGTLGATTLNSMANAINNAGQIVGQAEVTATTTHAFLVNSSSSLTMQDLGTLGGSNSSANGINASGQIVGNSLLTGDAAIHAFLYQNGTMTDLNTLTPSGSGWVLENASAINDVGQIIGTGTLNGSFTAFRLDPAGANGVNILVSELTNGSLPLNTGEVDVLRGTLNAASFLIRVGPSAAPLAKAAVTAFVDEVNLLERTGQLTSAEGAPLISEAQNIIGNL